MNHLGRHRTDEAFFQRAGLPLGRKIGAVGDQLPNSAQTLGTAGSFALRGAAKPWGRHSAITLAKPGFELKDRISARASRQLVSLT
ncbi:MAG TPA: hypothetical protein VEB39_04840 [Sphingomicrobium sp.]|nr:hypothetical protein [Sphingomicrobium sp.]